jgi:hypothetical protein
VTTDSIELGPLWIRFRADPYPWSGTPAAGGEYQSGNALAAGVIGPGGIALDLGVIAWKNSREVAALDCYDSPPRIQRLGHGGRIGIRPEAGGKEWMELRVSRMTTPEWSTEYRTTADELETVCRMKVGSSLRALGALSFGRRGDVLADSGRRRNDLAVVFPADDARVPIAAYCAVRVLPLLYGYGLENASLVE